MNVPAGTVNELRDRVPDGAISTILSRVPQEVAPQTSVQTLLNRLTASRAGYIDVLNGLSPGELKSQLFTASGTWTRPSGVDTVWVTMIGGGGSGGKESSNGHAYGGYAGEHVFRRIVRVSGNVQVTVGPGGVGQSVEDVSGSAGGSSSFGTVSVEGGALGPAGGSFDALAVNPWPTGYFSNGERIEVSGSVGRRYGGEASVFGNGGNGVNSNEDGALDSFAYGAGSGGVGPNIASSQAGGSGMCLVEWFE